MPPSGVWEDLGPGVLSGSDPYRVSWGGVALQPELAVVLLTAALVLPDLLTSVVVRQVQNLVGPGQVPHLQTGETS